MAWKFPRLTRSRDDSEKRSALSLDEWASFFSFEGLSYPFMGGGSLQSLEEKVPPNFEGYVEQAYKRNGVVFACMLVRQLLFSEARFQFQKLQSGRPGDLFGTQALQILETPWPNGTTGDLLTRAIQDVDLSGNFYAYRTNDQLYRMRPDWVTIVLGSESRPASEVEPGDLDVEVLGYAYQPGGPASGRDAIFLLRERVAHFAPIPDPCFAHRGMSWLTPVLRELMADSATTTHKLKFFENGASPNLVVGFDKDWNPNPQEFQTWVDAFDGQHAGVLNAYKTLYLAKGATATVVGANLKDAAFKEVQASGETRIAAAAGVPPVIVGLSEGLQSATYSNYSQARRRFADGTMRPLWRNFAGSMATVIPAPSGSRLWYDDRDIPFLSEDVKDLAEIQQLDAATIRTMVDAGFEPDAVIDAITAGDLQRLKGKHTGLFSIQLQSPGSPKLIDEAPGAKADTGAEAAKSNGKPPVQPALPPGKP